MEIVDMGRFFFKQDTDTIYKMTAERATCTSNLFDDLSRLEGEEQ